VGQGLVVVVEFVDTQKVKVEGESQIIYVTSANVNQQSENAIQ